MNKYYYVIALGGNMSSGFIEYGEITDDNFNDFKDKCVHNSRPNDGEFTRRICSIVSFQKILK